MRFAARLLSFILCLELIIGGHGPLIIMSSTALAAECPTGTSMDATLNRCLTSNQNSAINSAVASCKGLSSEEEKRQCYIRNAETALAGSGEKGKAKVKGMEVAGAAGVAVPLFFMIKAMSDGKGLKTCKPASLVLMYGAGAALLIGEVVSYIQHDKALKKMDDRRKELQIKPDGDNSDTNKANSTEIQSQAFELLAQNEDSVAKVAKTKFGTYLTATGLFAAGAVMAVIESAQLKIARAQLLKAETVQQGLATIRRIECKNIPTVKDPSVVGDAASTAAGGATAASGGGQTIGQQIKGAAVGAAVNTAVNKGMEAATSNKSKTEATVPAATQPKTCETGYVLVNNECISVDDCVHNQDLCSGGTTGLIDIQNLLKKDMKSKAIKNIAHARDVNELNELLRELDSIEYEPYSKISYADEVDKIDTKQDFSFTKLTAKIISEVLFMSEAQAFGGFGFGFDWGKLINAVKLGPYSNSIAAANTQVKGILNQAVYTPKGRLITNGLLGGWMGIMSSHMKKQQDISKDRAEMLRKLKSEFVAFDGLVSCTAAERNITSKPSCYCYTSDNKRNPARAASSICAKLWGTFNSASTDYLGGNDEKVCVSSSNTIDTTCSCRTQIGPDGKNTCLKVGSSINFPGLDTGSFKMLSSAMAPANSLYNGSAAAGTLDTPTIGTNAARIKAQADKLMQKELGSSKPISDMEKALKTSTAGMSMGGAAMDSSNSPTNMTPAQAAKALDEEIKKGTVQDINTAGSSESIGGGNSAPEQLEFGMTQEDLAVQEDQIAEVMNKDLDMNNADITKGSDTNLFEVLSNRYQRSGMRRLFDVDGKTKAERPAESDISQ